MIPPTDPPGAFWQGKVQYIIFACEECGGKYFQVLGHTKMKTDSTIHNYYSLSCCNCGSVRLTHVSSEYIPGYCRPGFWGNIPQTMPDVGACC